MNKLEAIAASKTFRKDADELLQRMKAHQKELRAIGSMDSEDFLDYPEASRHHAISITELENAIMRQGLTLKYIGDGEPPYPSSYDPASAKVEPTADGLKL